MTRLAVCAEGPTEGEFTNRVLAPHLTPMGVEARLVVLGRARTPRNGGNVTIERLGTDMAHLYYSFDVVTSLVDFYGFRDKGDRRIDELEADLRRAVARRVGHGWDRRKVVPYIQRHEFEGLLFSDVEAFARQRDFPSACVVALRAIRAAFKTPEDINDNRRTAPSKRIRGVIPRYNKRFHGPELAADIGLEVIRSACPRFGIWMRCLESLGTEPTWVPTRSAS